MMGLLNYKPNLDSENSFVRKAKTGNSPWPSVIGLTSSVSSETVGMFGLVVDSVICSTRRKSLATDFDATTLGWPLEPSLAQSSIINCANTLLFKDQALVGDAANKSDNGDWQVHLALALELMSRKRFLPAYTYLRKTIRVLEPLVPPYNLEYLSVSTELVKCYNYLSRAEEGETYALKAMKHPSFTDDSLSSPYQLQIAFADSLIGQGKYARAADVLEDVRSKVYTEQYLIIPVSLRLNKINRRLSRSNAPEFLTKLSLGREYHKQKIKTEIMDEYLDEVSATVSFQQQKSMDDCIDNSLIKESMDIANRSNSGKVWRQKRLRDHILSRAKPSMPWERSNVSLASHSDKEDQRGIVKPQLLIFVHGRFNSLSFALTWGLETMKSKIDFGISKVNEDKSKG